MPPMPAPRAPFAFAVLIRPITKPMMASGTFNQFAHPKNGIKNNSIPQKLIMPMMRLMSCIAALLSRNCITGQLATHDAL